MFIGAVEPNKQEGTWEVGLPTSGGGKGMLICWERVIMLHTVTFIVSFDDNIPGRLVVLFLYPR